MVGKFLAALLDFEHSAISKVNGFYVKKIPQNIKLKSSSKFLPAPNTRRSFLLDCLLSLEAEDNVLIKSLMFALIFSLVCFLFAARTTIISFIA